MYLWKTLMYWWKPPSTSGNICHLFLGEPRPQQFQPVFVETSKMYALHSLPQMDLYQYVFVSLITEKTYYDS